ncbi:hypothetical protein C8R43DRAFT_1117565 [Mycena crocata]|nr:hypothetical protein C8R43DRAFT_1117565 [Mycena crocata]
MSVVFRTHTVPRRSAPSRFTSDLTRITLSHTRLSRSSIDVLDPLDGATMKPLSALFRVPSTVLYLLYCRYHIPATSYAHKPALLSPHGAFLGTKTEDSKMLLIRLRLVYEATHADRFIHVPRPSTRLLVSPAPLSLARCSSTSATKEVTPATLLRSTSAPLGLSKLLSLALGGRPSPGLLPQKRTKSPSPPKPAGLQTRLSSPPSPNRIKLSSGIYDRPPPKAETLRHRRLLRCKFKRLQARADSSCLSF